MSKKHSLVVKNKNIQYNNVIYLINEKESTACVIGCIKSAKQILIPRSIIRKSKKYEVTSISAKSFEFSLIKLVQFASDSKIRMFDTDALYYSSIESISFPSELVELKEGWCNSASSLNKIEVSPNNPRYCCYEDKMIIGKTNVDQSNYDCLVFCSRDVQNVTIPNFIEHICAYSFNYCKKIQRVEIPKDSKLQTIDKYAFSCSVIKSIAISSSVKIIGENAFYYCKQIERVEIPDDSELQTIDNNAFCYSTIENITIPSSVTLIGENAFTLCIKLMQFGFANNSKLQTIGKEAFSHARIKRITIPSSVTFIGEKVFYSCTILQRIEFQNDSKLKTIGKEAFSNTNIVVISIPPSVTFIGENAFSECSKLLIIEINNHAEMLSMYQAAVKNCQNVLLMIAV